MHKWFHKTVPRSCYGWKFSSKIRQNATKQNILLTQVLFNKWKWHIKQCMKWNELIESSKPIIKFHCTFNNNFKITVPIGVLHSSTTVLNISSVTLYIKLHGTFYNPSAVWQVQYIWVYIFEGSFKLKPS